MAHGTFPDQGLNPHALHWKCRVLITEPLRKSNVMALNNIYFAHKNLQYGQGLAGPTQPCST